jgi:hypothetical protein
MEGLFVLVALVFHADTVGSIALDAAEGALMTGSTGAVDADERGRVLHDRLAGTMVVRVTPL